MSKVLDIVPVKARSVRSIPKVKLPAREEMIRILSEALNTDNSRRAYTTAINHFFDWVESSKTRQSFDWESVRKYRAHMQTAEHLSASTINLRLASIRKLAEVLWLHKLIPKETFDRVTHIDSVKKHGERVGNWLTLEQAQEFINSPLSNIAGRRDRAILAVLTGCGLRRTEMVTIAWGNLITVAGRWVIANFSGKGDRTRSVPAARWVKDALDSWAACLPAEAKKPECKIFISLPKSYACRWSRTDVIRSMEEVGKSMTATAIYDVVVKYAKRAKIKVAPHDLRRTFAQLAYEMKPEQIGQVKTSMGHSSVTTTERYLSTTQRLKDTPSDWINITIEEKIEEKGEQANGSETKNETPVHGMRVDAGNSETPGSTNGDSKSDTKKRGGKKGDRLHSNPVHP